MNPVNFNNVPKDILTNNIFNLLDKSDLKNVGVCKQWDKSSNVLWLKYAILDFGEKLVVDKRKLYGKISGKQFYNKLVEEKSIELFTKSIINWLKNNSCTSLNMNYNPHNRFDGPGSGAPRLCTAC